jgi:hypothetical protein
MGTMSQPSAELWIRNPRELQKERPNTLSCLLFQQSTSCKIGRLLVYNPANKRSRMLRPVNGNLTITSLRGLQYSVRMWTDRSISWNSASPALAEHSTKSGNVIEFQETEVPLKTSGYMDRLAKEEWFGLSKAWNPGIGVIRTLTAHGWAESREGKHTEEQAAKKRNWQHGHEVGRGWVTPQSDSTLLQHSTPVGWVVDLMNWCIYWTTSTLVLQTEEITETVVLNSTRTRLIALEDGNTDVLAW